MVTHTYDPVSIAYWQAMGGEYGDDDNDDEDSWSNDLTASLTTVQGNFSNVDVFYIDGNGHCSFGLQYALQEDGFEEFAEGILTEQQLLRKTASSAPYLALSAVLGSILTLLASLSRSRSENKSEEPHDETYYKEDLLDKQSLAEKTANAVSPMVPFAQRFEKCPITSGLFLTTTVYFLAMLIFGGFEHPLNNPSLGPSAATLSTFGINNPTLVVTKNQILRLFTSPVVCSGVITYLMFTSFIFKCMRHVEAAISSNIVFGAVLLVIAFGSNLIYTLCGEGASCGSLALALGMNTFSIAMSRKYGFDLQFPRLWVSTFFATLFAVTLLPFNSWIMIVAAMSIGAFVAPFIVNMDDYFVKQNHLERLSKVPLIVISAVYSVIFILILSNVPKPDVAYQYPYLTGCAMMYTPDLDAVMGDFGGERRLQEEMEAERELGDYDGLCAQFCVPHLINRPFEWSVAKYTDYEMSRGKCEDIGYDAHAADKTITYFGYSLDVEGYYSSGDDDDKN